MPGRGKDVKPSHCELRFREEKKKRKREIEGKSEDREKKWGRRQRSSLRSPRSGTGNPNIVRTPYVPRIYTKGPQVGNDTLL